MNCMSIDINNKIGHYFVDKYYFKTINWNEEYGKR